jgi:hypothetical protein
VSAQESHRWNFHDSRNGEIQLCRGNHPRGTGCEYETYVEASKLEEARAEIERLREALANQRAWIT